MNGITRKKKTLVTCLWVYAMFATEGRYAG